MAESEWTQGAEEAPPKKKRVPTWVWWTCGGGCLLTTLLVGTLVVVVGKLARDYMDPDKAWEDVRETMPYDERPAGWEARGVSVMGMGHYFLLPEPGTVIIVQTFRGTPELDAMFDPESVQNRGLAMFDAIQNAQAGTFQLQGREVRTLRFDGGIPEELLRGDGPGNGIRLDLSTAQRKATVQISVEGAEEPVTDERVAELLAPFDVWRGQ